MSEKITKIGVLSDSHRNAHMIMRTMDTLGEMDYWFHLGDGVKDLEIIETLYEVPCYGVRGNCDFSDQYPDKHEIEIDGLKIFLTHGHFYNVRNTKREIEKLAKDNDYDIVLFGHTHIPELYASGKRVYMNPGSITYPKGESKKPTCGYIELRDGEIFPKLLLLDD